jgi:anaerobic magnesium-protoporphyrin IX monomethyl ester cyclase
VGFTAESGGEVLKTVCLIIPPSPFLLDERVFMSLGILKIAAVLERRNVPVEVLDLSGIQNFTEALSCHVEHSDTMFYGITATTPQMPSASILANVIRRIRPEARIILGGPHPTLVLAACKKEKTPGRASRARNELNEVFDVIVAGDGEEAIFRALEANVPKWIDADDPKGLLFLTNEALNELPYPARHLVDVESYHYYVDGERATSLIAQLGCPFPCGFCGGRNSPMLRRVRMRTTKSVVDEVKGLYNTYGVKGFMFYDDELNVNPRMIEMMNEIEKAQDELGVQFRLRGFLKSQLFTDDQAKAMVRAGFKWILVGFESGSERILTNINKRSTRSENTRCVEIAKRHGLKVKALMSIGHPGESLETLKDTRDWLLMAKPDDFDVTIITPYPGSPYYDDSIQDDSGDWVYTYEKTGDKLYSEEVDYFKTADYYKGDPNGGYRSYVYTDNLSKGELVKERDKLEFDIRRELNIPFNPSMPASRFEHSMGNMSLPPNILKSSNKLRGGHSIVN